MMIDHLLAHDRALCFIGMGVGKTAGCLATINELRNQGNFQAALIIAPLRVCNLTWPMEVKQWENFRWMKVANLRTPLGRRAFIAGLADIYLINYEGIPLLKTLVDKRGGEVPYDTLIIDESTRTKNAKSKRITMFRNNVPAVNRRWALTGTPAPNSLLDIWGQVRMVDDGERLGPSFAAFQKAHFTSDYMGYKHTANEGAKEYVEDKISDITITLRSSDWLKDVPDYAIEDVEIPLGHTLMEQYLEFERELLLELHGNVNITAANAAALVSKLLQFTSGAVYDADKVQHGVHDLKMKALARIIKQTQGPVLVAVNFQHEQSRIRKAFPQARFFADAKNETMQLNLLQQWNEGKIPMLVVHPASCGHGLNLQKGSSTMVWTTLTYSRENYEQTIARLWRRGQKDAVTVYRLMCPDTVDDVVAEVLANKRANEDSLLSALQMLESARGVKPRPHARKAVAKPAMKEDDFWS
jgi:SNF2 family DNA or RNA helicase